MLLVCAADNNKYVCKSLGAVTVENVVKKVYL